MKKAKIAMSATIAAAGLALAGGFWTAEINVGTNGVSLGTRRSATEWQLIDAISPSNKTVTISYVTAATNTSAAGVITNGVLVPRGAVIPPVQGGARLVLKSSSGTVPVLATIEGAGLTTE